MRWRGSTYRSGAFLHYPKPRTPLTIFLIAFPSPLLDVLNGEPVGADATDDATSRGDDVEVGDGGFAVIKLVVTENGAWRMWVAAYVKATGGPRWEGHEG